MTASPVLIRATTDHGRTRPKLPDVCPQRPSPSSPESRLHELGHHGNHEVEKTNGLDEGETKNGVGEELATHAGVAADSKDESTEDDTDTDTGTTETNGGVTHAEVLRDLDEGVGHLGAVGAVGLLVELSGPEDGRGLSALDGLEGSGTLDSRAGDYS